MASAHQSFPSELGSTSNSPRRAPRSKTGCLTCRRRKVRCNEQKPRCSHCERLSLQCTWRTVTSIPQVSRQIFGNDNDKSTSSNIEVPNSQKDGDTFTSDFDRQTVDESFNDMFDYANFMWNHEPDGTMQPQSWGGVGYSDSDFQPGNIRDDLSHHEQLLKDYFIQTVVPPIIAQVETQLRWSSMRQILVSMSATSAMVHYAILAFSQLLSDRNAHTQSLRYHRYYDSARLELSRQKADGTSIGFRSSYTELDHTLATLFFLSYIDLLEGRIVDAHANLKEAYEAFSAVDKSQLRDISKRLISWMRLLDARAVTAGGEGLFLSGNDDIITQSSPASTDVTESAGNNDTTEASVEDVLFDTLYHPGFAFFQRIQSFMGRITMIDPWHRPRGTVEDETEVMSIAAKISQDLGILWDSRPPLMDHVLNGNLTSAHLSPSLVFTITRAFRTYFANFNASKIHLHRVAYKHLPLSADTEQAISSIWNTARLMVDNGAASSAEHNMLPVNMLWPLLMLGCEEDDPDIREWIIAQIKGMEQVATNANITAQVLLEVQKRQDLTNQRVDVRTVMHDIFNSCFAIV